MCSAILPSSGMQMRQSPDVRNESRYFTNRQEVQARHFGTQEKNYTSNLNTQIHKHKSISDPPLPKLFRRSWINLLP